MDNATMITYLLIGTYLLAGAIFLSIFDLVTKRIRNRLLGATAETQQKLGAAGAPMSGRAAKWAFIILMWTFWPVVIIGAFTHNKINDREIK